MQVGEASRSRNSIWFVDLGRTGRALLDLEAKERLIDAETAASLDRLSDPRHRDERRVAHVALRLALAHTFRNDKARHPYARDRHGKPRLAGLPGDFSLAHTDGAALIAVSTNGRVGIDLEAPRTPRLDERRRQRIEAAAEDLPGPGPLPAEAAADARFLMAWTRLEAFAKADGRGMGRLMTALGIVGSHRDRPLAEAMTSVTSGAPALKIADLVLPVPTYVAAWASEPCESPPPVLDLAGSLDRLAAIVRSP